MVRVALRIAVVAATALTGGCFYYPYGYGYRYGYPGYVYGPPAPVVVYGGSYRYYR